MTWHSVPMHEYPVPIHTLIGNQFALLRPRGPAASQAKRFGIGTAFTSDYCYMLGQYGPYDPNFFEGGMPQVAAHMALEANDVNEARGYGAPYHEIHFLEDGGLYTGQTREDSIRRLGSMWDARGPVAFEGQLPIDSYFAFHGRRDLSYLVVRAIVEHLLFHGERARKFVFEAWIIHHQARRDVPFEELKVGIERYHLSDFLLANVRLIAEQVSKGTQIRSTWFRTNEEAHRNQEMRDGEFSFQWPDGTIMHTRDEVGTLELAAGDYTALVMAADYFQDMEDMCQETAIWRAIAEELRRNSLNLFRVSTNNGSRVRFGMAIQRNPENPLDSAWQLLPTRGSGWFEAFDGLFMTNLPEEEYEINLQSMVEESRSDSFLTEPGLRMVAAEHVDAYGMVRLPRRPHDVSTIASHVLQYQSPETSWVVTAGLVANAYERHGLHGLARDMRLRPTLAAAKARAILEFFITLRDGTTFYRYAFQSDRSAFSPPGEVVVALNVPEEGQGFSNSVPLRAALTEYYPLAQLMPKPTRFQSSVESESLAVAPSKRLISRSEALAGYEDLPVCYVDTEEAVYYDTYLKAEYRQMMHPIRDVRALLPMR